MAALLILAAATPAGCNVPRVHDGDAPELPMDGRQVPSDRQHLSSAL